LKLCLNEEDEKKKKKYVAQLEQPPNANERTNKNDHFSVRSTTDSSWILKCVAQLDKSRALHNSAGAKQGNVRGGDRSTVRKEESFSVGRSGRPTSPTPMEK
jgi:hypothetical protein